MSLRFPYLALDIETTGLDRQRVHVLQLAAIYDNGLSPEKLPTFEVVIRWPVITYGEEYAMHLNRHLLERAFKKDRVVSIEEAREQFSKWLDFVQPSGKITLAGKNAAGFDVPILANPVNNFSTNKFIRRVLDPGSMYAEDFTHIPDQSEINKLIGREAVTHDALEDCWDVVYAIRNKWGY